MDYATGPWRHRFLTAKQKPDLLRKAIFGKRPPKDLTVWDATGGLARDALLLNLWGANVYATEVHPKVFLEVSEALKKLKNSEEKLSKIFHWESFQYTNEDSWMKLKEEIFIDRFHVIYMDPLFPKDIDDRKSLPTKEWVLLRETLQNEDSLNTEKFLEALLEKFHGRIVLKRPHKAEVLHSKFRKGSVEGKAVRFDLY